MSATTVTSRPGLPYRERIDFAQGHVSRGHSLTAHPADGKIAQASYGDDWHMSFKDPTADTGLVWIQTWGNVESVRYSVAAILESYDYLLSGNITHAEANKRLRMLRGARAELLKAGPLPDRGTPTALNQSENSHGE